MQLINRANLAPAELAQLEAELPEAHSLAEVIEWGLRQAPPWQIATVVPQDEFTHDVIIPWRSRRALVYGVT